MQWFSVNQKQYFSLAVVRSMDVKRKDPYKKAEDGRLYGCKTMKLIDENAAQDVFLEERRAEEKRREEPDSEGASMKVIDTSKESLDILQQANF